MQTTIIVESVIHETPRVAQVRGLFDLPAQKCARLRWDVRLPLENRLWSIGLITGPSGCGKSTIARRLWPTEYAESAALDASHWPSDRAIVDAFPESVSVKEVTALLTAVGFSSPPAWLRPFRVLSTGQQFRVTLARLLARAAGTSALVVCDEFTSVVDRVVAQVGSAAVARAIRQRGGQLVAVTCHEDVIDWLQPDWVYRPAEPVEGRFQWRCLQRRPAITLEVSRCSPKRWGLYAPHHYLSSKLVRAARCFEAWWAGRPVAFSAWLPFVGAGPPARREHRTVVLPDYQGVGVGQALAGLIASLWRGLGYRSLSTTTHPGLIASRCRSPDWLMHRSPALARGHEHKKQHRGLRLRHATTRLTAGFEYVGQALSRRLAERLLGVQ